MHLINNFATPRKIVEVKIPGVDRSKQDLKTLYAVIINIKHRKHLFWYFFSTFSLLRFSNEVVSKLYETIRQTKIKKLLSQNLSTFSNNLLNVSLWEQLSSATKSTTINLQEN